MSCLTLPVALSGQLFARIPVFYTRLVFSVVVSADATLPRRSAAVTVILSFMRHRGLWWWELSAQRHLHVVSVTFIYSRRQMCLHTTVLLADHLLHSSLKITSHICLILRAHLQSIFLVRFLKAWPLFCFFSGCRLCSIRGRETGVVHCSVQIRILI